jgi:hypothetical protein
VLRGAEPGLTEREARQIIDSLKNNPGVRAPVPYLTAAIANGDAQALIAEARDQLARHDAMQDSAAHGQPRPWCRNCDQHTRLTDEDHPRRCPDCHPLTAEAAP